MTNAPPESPSAQPEDDDKPDAGATGQSMTDDDVVALYKAAWLAEQHKLARLPPRFSRGEGIDDPGLDPVPPHKRR